MKNLTITKWLVSLALVLTLSVSSFAMGPGNKPAKPGNNNGKVKVEQKYHKKDIAQHWQRKGKIFMPIYRMGKLGSLFFKLALTFWLGVCTKNMFTFCASNS